MKFPTRLEAAKNISSPSKGSPFFSMNPGVALHAKPSKKKKNAISSFFSENDNSSNKLREKEARSFIIIFSLLYTFLITTKNKKEVGSDLTSLINSGQRHEKRQNRAHFWTTLLFPGGPGKFLGTSLLSNHIFKPTIYFEFARAHCAQTGFIARRLTQTQLYPFLP